MASDEHQRREQDLKRLRKVRHAMQLRRDAKIRGVRFRSMSDWLDAGRRGSFDGTMLSEADILVAATGAALPSIGAYWTALIAINRGSKCGHVWVNAIKGDHSLDKIAPRVAAGSGEIPDHLVAKLVTLFDRHGLAGFASVPTRCYDGAPVSLMVCSPQDGQVFDVRANCCDHGKEPALALVRTIWAIHDAIELIEQPPDDPGQLKNRY